MSMSVSRINKAASSVYGGMMRNEDRQERKTSAVSNLARVLGFDHGDRVSYMNLTREPAWPGMR